MNMVKYILRRILLMVIVLAGVSVITFGIAHNIPVTLWRPTWGRRP